MARWNVATWKIRNAFILSTLSSLWLTFTNSSLFIIAAPTTYRCGRSNGFLLLNSLSNLFDKLTKYKFFYPEQAQTQIATTLFSFIVGIVGLNVLFQNHCDVLIDVSKYMILGFFPDWNIFEFYYSNWLLAGILLLVAVIYYTVQIIYMSTILNLKTKKNLQKPRIQ